MKKISPLPVVDKKIAKVARVVSSLIIIQLIVLANRPEKGKSALLWLVTGMRKKKRQ